MLKLFVHAHLIFFYYVLLILLKLIAIVYQKMDAKYKNNKILITTFLKYLSSPVS